MCKQRGTECFGSYNGRVQLPAASIVTKCPGANSKARSITPPQDPYVSISEDLDDLEKLQPLKERSYCSESDTSTDVDFDCATEWKRRRLLASIVIFCKAVSEKNMTASDKVSIEVVQRLVTLKAEYREWDGDVPELMNEALSKMLGVIACGA